MLWRQLLTFVVLVFCLSACSADVAAPAADHAAPFGAGLELPPGDASRSAETAPSAAPLAGPDAVAADAAGALAGRADVNVAPDAGAVSDVGAAPDVAAVFDAAAAPDLGAPSEVGAATDAGAKPGVDAATIEVGAARGGSDAGWADAGGAAAVDGNVSAADAAPAWLPPPSGDPDQGGLTNIGTDLKAVLQWGKLPGACTAWHATQGKGTLQQKLLCGRAMFFYESFGTFGVPQPIVDFMIKNLPNSVGPGMAKFGMHTDPNAPKQLPLGLAVGANLPKTIVPTYTFTCVSCHFGKLSDGRYVVGQANHAYA